jgi:hypothetical protein
MRSDDFFQVDDWNVGPGLPRVIFNEELVDQIRRGPVNPWTDVEVGVALALLIDAELKIFGTSGALEGSP